MSPLLEMRGISKGFPGVRALDKVDLSLDKGEVLALVGENGAGKSTLMNILGGIYQPDSGSVFVDGKETSIDGVEAAIDLGIAFIHQELNVVDNLDVAANIFLGREPRIKPFGLVDRKKIHADAEPYINRLGLDIPSDTRLDKLSVAYQQMVEIAKALSLNARIIIMDEPTSSLTLTETKRLLELVKELREQGVSIIYISHRLGEVDEIADRALVLRDGKNAGELKREKISHDNLVNLMVGRDIDSFYVESKIAEAPGHFQARGLRSNRYPDQEVSFDASKGEILGFAGLVGAGRSEIAKALVRLDTTSDARIRIDGNEISVNTPKDAINNGIYLVPEDRRAEGLVTAMSIRENITLPDLDNYAKWGLINTEQERTATTEQVAKLKVKTPNNETLVQNLSGGNQQKVVLAKWLSMKPKVMILDEPTRGIDVGSKAEFYHLMRDLADQGEVIIMISSDMEEILHVCDRIAVMHEGRITGVLDREDFTETNIMQLAVGQNVAAAHPPF
ncbi:MAG: sugar ABC transporter ATP-binding protein [Verrucomicrobia bacterium]|nr:sugar ABC transporter ATP-binding protein [Verrucomicrobiota bacterium]